MKRIGFAPGKSFGYAEDGTPVSFGCSKAEAFELIENDSAGLPPAKREEALGWLDACRRELEVQAARKLKAERPARQKRQALLRVYRDLLAVQKSQRRFRLPRRKIF